MRKEDKDIYKQVAERHKINEELVKEVGDTIFQAWRDWQQHPDNLRLIVEGLGTQIVRKKKLHGELDKMFETEVDYIEESNNTFESEEDYFLYKKEQEWYLNILHLQTVYKKYTAERAEIRKLRNAVQKPLTPTTLQSKESKETGQNYFEEC